MPKFFYLGLVLFCLFPRWLRLLSDCKLSKLLTNVDISFFLANSTGLSNIVLSLTSFILLSSDDFCKLLWTLFYFSVPFYFVYFGFYLFAFNFKESLWSRGMWGFSSWLNFAWMTGCSWLVIVMASLVCWGVSFWLRFNFWDKELSGSTAVTVFSLNP